METIERLKEELLALPVEQRAELAHFLVGSLDSEGDSEVQTAWEQELERRAAEIESGNAIGKPAEQVFADLRRKYQ
jgi:putative addiction module component (TIGR02574 family)